MGSKMAAASRVVQVAGWDGTGRAGAGGAPLAQQRFWRAGATVTVTEGRALWQVVKPHTPLIKFPDRQSTPKLKIQESLQARVPPLHGSAIPLSVGSKQPVLENISPISRVQGVPDTSELVRTLPQKYRRKTMSDEEMEFIQRGGPE